MMQHAKNPWLTTRTRTGAEYDAPYFERAALGIDIHGEANLVEKLLQTHYQPAQADKPYRVLDAGCGTGRMGIELARRGFEVVGVDLDEVMLSQARAKAPVINWHCADLATVVLEGQFDAIAMAGNVMIYVTPGTEAAVLANLSRYLKPNGLLLAAFELGTASWTTISAESYNQLATDAGLRQLARWSTWDQDLWRQHSPYLVSLHQKT